MALGGALVFCCVFTLKLFILLVRNIIPQQIALNTEKMMTRQTIFKSHIQIARPY